MTPEYRTYLLTRAWQVKRAGALHRAGYRCERCFAKYGLEVHHTTYERLGAERHEDLEVLCKRCHPVADAERARQTQARQRRKALITFADKKYGGDWERLYTLEEIEDEFEAWLERKGWG
jgi:5-methylcytosine-specific restriction endonuclease McrA